MDFFNILLKAPERSAACPKSVKERRPSRHISQFRYAIPPFSHAGTPDKIPASRIVNRPGLKQKA